MTEEFLNMNLHNGMPIKLKPYKHQIQGFNLCMENDGYGLLFDVGLGKSLTAAAVAGARYIKGEVNKVLIICPLAVLSVWEKEFKNLTVDNTLYALDGSLFRRLDMLRHFPKTGLNVAVINYEGARTMEEYLLKWQPDLLIVDESQRIKNPLSQQSRTVHKLAKQINYRIILTATPIGNSAADVFSQWKVIDENIFGKSYYSFLSEYFIKGSRKKVKNMQKLLDKAHSKALRVAKEDALDLPEQIFETRFCQLEPKAKNIYNSLKTECYSEISGGGITTTNILVKLLKLQQCADGFLKITDGEFYETISTAKLDVLKETVEDVISAGEKIVIFARFTHEIKAIYNEFTKMNIKSLILNGSVKDKGGVVKEFQENKDIKVIICQTQVGSVGITLTAASVAIFYSMSFSLIDYLQAVGRIHRIGQKTRCLYINLITKNTVDEKILSAIENKKNLSEYICNNWKEVFE